MVGRRPGGANHGYGLLVVEQGAVDHADGAGGDALNAGDIPFEVTFGDPSAGVHNRVGPQRPGIVGFEVDARTLVVGDRAAFDGQCLILVVEPKTVAVVAVGDDVDHMSLGKLAYLAPVVALPITPAWRPRQLLRENSSPITAKSRALPRVQNS